MTRKHLKLTPYNTQAVLLVGGRNKMKIHLVEIMIEDQDMLRYLGIHVDRNLGMATHIKRTAKKACKTLASVARRMPKVGPGERNRRILSSVAESISITQYHASIWETAMSKKVDRNILDRVWRRTVILIARAYRTPSTFALLVAARVPLWNS